MPAPHTVLIGLICWAALALSPTQAQVSSSPAGAPAVQPASAEAGEFEGRYRVGNTSCTVSPAKMSFDVKWAKGRGVMHFFFEGIDATGRPVFAGQGGGASKAKDRFVFDNENYDAGQFIRADGAVFSLSRME